MIGNGAITPSNGNSIGWNWAVSGNCGVRPPCDQIALPISAVMPAATMLIAVPETIWLARWSIEA